MIILCHTIASHVGQSHPPPSPPSLQLQVDIFDKNFFFAARCCQAFVPTLIETSGSIINVGSITGLSPLSKVFMYGSSKAALSNLSQNLAREYGEKLRVNLLIPGFFPAEQNRKILSKERTASIMNHTPANRFGGVTLKYRVCQIYSKAPPACTRARVDPLPSCPSCPLLYLLSGPKNR